MTPARLQLRRSPGFRLQEVSLALNGLPARSVARPGRHGNPFAIGAWMKIGDGRPGTFSWLRAASADYADASFTLVESADQAVAMFRTYRERYPLPPPDRDELVAHNLACWCAIGRPCHADVLLELLR